jgi:hypothetical protein
MDLLRSSNVAAMLCRDQSSTNRDIELTIVQK